MALFLGLFLGIAFPPVVQAQGDEPRALRERALASLDAQDPQLTVSLARELLARVPGDYEGLFLLSLGLGGLGDFDGASDAAAAAFGAATTGSERIEAARLAAGANLQSERYLRAQWWLRRAANHARSAADRQTLATEFRNVQSLNPWQGSLSFSVAPSDNINGGSEDGSIFLDDFEIILPPESRALSGLEISGSASLSYRLSADARQSTEVGVYLYHRDYILSDETRESVPDVRGGDFALSVAELSLRHSRLLFPGVGVSTASVSFGKVRYGGDPLWDYQRATLGQDIAIGRRGLLGLQFAFQEQDSRSLRQTDAESTEIQISYSHLLETGAEWSVSAFVQSHRARADVDSFELRQLSASYDFGAPVLGARLSLGAGLGQTTYDAYALSFDGRRDRYAWLSARADLEQISYFGFSPSVRVNARRTLSNIAQFEGDEVQLRLGIESNF